MWVREGSGHVYTTKDVGIDQAELFFLSILFLLLPPLFLDRLLLPFDLLFLVSSITLDAREFSLALVM